MTNPFKLCPHCGSKTQLTRKQEGGVSGNLLKCLRCPASMWMAGLPEFLVSAWNSRTPDPVDLLVAMKRVRSMCRDPEVTIDQVAKYFEETINKHSRVYGE